MQSKLLAVLVIPARTCRFLENAVMFGLFLKNPATPKIRLQCGLRAARIRSMGEIAKQALMTFARTRVTDRILFRIGGKAIETILNDDWILLKVIQRKKWHPAELSFKHFITNSLSAGFDSNTLPAIEARQTGKLFAGHFAYRA